MGRYDMDEDTLIKMIRQRVGIGAGDISQGRGRGQNPALGGIDRIYTILEALRRRLAVALGRSGLGADVFSLPTAYENNPVMDYTPDRSYYPTLLYFSGGFTPPGGFGTFKYICISQNYSGSSGLDLRGSNDCKNWTRATAAGLVGLTNPAHPFVVATPGEAAAYRIYYWDTANLYTVAAMRTATSDDLVNWSNDAPLANGAYLPIVTGVSPDWNRGSYGPSTVLFNPAATNPAPGPGVNPFDYSYVLYFDATTGGVQDIGLGYSADGVTFDLYGQVFTFSANCWDATHVSSARVFQIPDGRWLMIYSGGDGASNHGIGMAVSADGLDWKRLSHDPMLARWPLHWRAERCYAAAVLTDFDNNFDNNGDSADIKMLVSGRQTIAGTAHYAMGYFHWPTLFTRDANKALIPQLV